ncbi:hypothetical protein HaLaN_20287, partial [Haematococcus lacustris]
MPSWTTRCSHEWRQEARGGRLLVQAHQAGQAAVAGPCPGTGLWGCWLQWQRQHWLQGCPSQPDAEGGAEAVPSGASAANMR